MSAGPDRFDVAQLAADAAEWDELTSRQVLDVGGAAAVRWHDLRGELAEAAAPAAAHMALQVEEIAELRRRLEEERVGCASSRRHLQGQLDWALAEIKRLQAAAGAAPVPDAVLEERARQLSESLDVELEHVRHLEARQQALVTGFCAELAAALELPAGSAMDDIAAEVLRLAGGGWLEMRHEVERLRDFGLEAARIAARAEVTRSDILRAEDLIAEIERKP